MIESYADAARIARPIGRAYWEERNLLGEYYISPDGHETDDVFVIIDGAREDLVGGDESFVPMDKPVLLVDKATGLVASVDGATASDLIDEAREVSA